MEKIALAFGNFALVSHHPVSSWNSCLTLCPKEAAMLLSVMEVLMPDLVQQQLESRREDLPLPRQLRYIGRQDTRAHGEMPSGIITEFCGSSRYIGLLGNKENEEPIVSPDPHKSVSSVLKHAHVCD